MQAEQEQVREREGGGKRERRDTRARAHTHTHTHTQVNFESEWTELGKLMQHDAKIKAFVKQAYRKPP